MDVIAIIAVLGGAIFWIYYGRRPSYSEIMLEIARKEAAVNSIIRDMRCASCDGSKMPVYRIIQKNEERIDCCCEPFARILEKVINDYHRSGGYKRPTTSVAQPDQLKPVIKSAPAKIPLVQCHRPQIFTHFDPAGLGKEPIHDAIRAFRHRIVAYNIGTLESGSKYAMLIGTSDEWVSVISYNWAMKPTYQEYGFSIKENRWSYGSKVLGAPQIKAVIRSSLAEITSIIATQEPARRLKAEERRIREVEEEQKEREEQAEFDNTQEERSEVIARNFRGLEFCLINSKLNDASVATDIGNSHYKINLHSQVCSCDDFQTRNKDFPRNDVRRLCRHLRHMIVKHGLFVDAETTINDFILYNAWGNLRGVHLNVLETTKAPFAVLAYTWTTDIFVVTPNKDGSEFTMVRWASTNGKWRASRANFSEEISNRLAALFS